VCILQKKIKYMFTSVTIIFLCYLLVLIFVFFYQRNLLYHPFENNYNTDTANFSYEEVFISTSDGKKLKAWFHIKDLKQKKTLVFFHGNAGDLRNRIYKLNLIKNFDINFLIVAYRGFSGNEGSPTEEGLYQDARDTLDWLNKQKIEDRQIIIYGESLGTGVSTEIAQNKKFAGIILESPFTSMVDAGKHYYFYLPVSLLLKDRYETIKKLKNIKIPILVMHGENDKIVPFHMGKKVFLEANEPKYSYFPKDDDHMMEYNENLLEALNKFLKSI
tara:strand:- start:7357 stop:8178 length:822 start_codon:yes stop_codon:yes gene_type:complete